MTTPDPPPPAAGIEALIAHFVAENTEQTIKLGVADVTGVADPGAPAGAVSYTLMPRDWLRTASDAQIAARVRGLLDQLDAAAGPRSPE